MKKVPAPQLEHPVVKFAKVKLKGETYSLAFDFNSLALAEQMAGVNLMLAFRSWNDLSISQTRALLYAALRKHHASLTLAEVGGLMELQNLGAIADALGEALANSLPPDVANRPPEPEPEPADH